MAKNRGNGRPFEKGHKPVSQTLVKGHNLALTADEYKVRKLTAKQVLEVIQTFTQMKASALTEKLLDPEISVLELAVGRIFADVINHGDHNKLAFLFDRSLGKVKEKVEVNLPKPTVMKLIGQDAAIAIGINQTLEEE